MKLLLAFLMVALTFGCASITKPESIKQQIAYGYANLAAARDSTAGLLARKAITKEEAVKFQATFDTVRAGLDTASTAAGAGDISKAEDQLRLAVSLLTAVEIQLKAREAK
jgi:hypothetical protein